MIRSTAMLIVVCATVGLGSAGAAPQTPSSSAAGPLFSGGRGDTWLPPIKVSAPSTLRWTSNGPIFQIYAQDALGGEVNAAAPSGAGFLKVGTHRLRVNAYGDWTIRVVPGVERPRPLGSGLVGFRGNGARDLPPFTTPRGVTLIWTNSGPFFRIFSGAFSLSVKSTARRGKRYLNPGSHNFEINASGSWTIGWKP